MSDKKKPATGARPRDLSIVLKDAPPGAWVALSHDKTRIVGTGTSIRAAAFEAQLNGEGDPVLIKMPLEGEGSAAGVKIEPRDFHVHDGFRQYPSAPVSRHYSPQWFLHNQ